MWEDLYHVAFQGVRGANYCSLVKSINTLSETKRQTHKSFNEEQHVIKSKLVNHKLSYPYPMCKYFKNKKA